MERLITVTLSQVQAGSARIRYDYDDGTPGIQVQAPTAAIEELLDRADTDYYITLPENPEQRSELLESLGKRLFDFLDTGDRRISGYIERTSGTWEVLALGIRVERPADTLIDYLPWELLHDGTSFLVGSSRPVVPIRFRPGESLRREPQARPLRLLFMACAPDDIRVPLDFENEEAQIWQATAGQPIELQVEESGNLLQLGDLVESYSENHFDVVHLTGHAGRTLDGPRFLTEDQTGGRVEASAADLRRALSRTSPALVFLSGCRTGEAADVGAVPSLAQELLDGPGAPVVLGWGRPVPDDIATEATAVLYRGLAQGRSPTVAMAMTYRSLLERGTQHWHLLRIFARGGMPGPLVTRARVMLSDRAQTRRPERRQAIGDLSLPDPRSFVGRRREVQRMLGLLGSAAESGRVGILIHGMGGIGKTTLVGRVLSRLADSYRPVVFHDYLTEDGLLAVLADDPALADALGECPPTLPFRQRLWRFLNHVGESGPSGRGRNLLFVLDEFELNFRPDDATAGGFSTGPVAQFRDERPLLRPAAAAVLDALVSAVLKSDFVHQIVITSRYVPTVECIDHFELLPLGPPSRTDIDKMVVRLRRRGDVPSPVVASILDKAGGNPRLLNWLFGLAETNIVIDEDVLRAKLSDERMVFLEKNIFADTLLASQSEASRNLLRAAAPFRVFVTPAVLADLTVMDIAAATGRAENLARLSLLEQTSHADGGTGFRVPLVLASEPTLRDESPQASARCAEALAKGLGSFLNEPDARRLDRPRLKEVHRLAVAGGARNLAVETACALAEIELWYFHNEEAAEICRRELARFPDHRLYALLAEAEAELGYAENSRLHFAKALETCPADATVDRAWTSAWQAFHREDTDSADFARQVDEVSRVAESSHDDSLLSFCLRMKAAALGPRGGTRTAEADRLFAQALTLCQRIPDSGLRAANVLGERAWAVYLVNGDVERAMTDMEEALGVYERNGRFLNQARILISLSSACLRQGETDQAEKLAARAARVNESIRSVRTDVEIAILQAALALVREDTRAAEELYAAAAGKARDIGSMSLEASALNGLQEVYIRGGRKDRAGEALRSAKVLSDQLGSPSQYVDALLISVVGDRQAGEPDKAVTRAREAAEIARTADLAELETRAWVAYVELADSATIPAEDLEPALRRLRELQHTVGDSAAEAGTLTQLSSLLLAGGRPGEASEPLHAALSLYQGLRDDGGQARTHAQLAGLAATLGEPDEAGARWGQAARLYHDANDAGNAALALREAATVAWQQSGGPAASIAVHERAQLAALSLAGAAAAPATESQVLRDLADLADADGRAEVAARRRSDAVWVGRRSDALQFHVGQNLVPLIDPDQGAPLMAAVGPVRETLKAEDDMVLPGVRFFDDLSLALDGYVIYVWGDVAFQGSVPTDRPVLLPAGDGPDDPDVRGEPGFLPRRVRWLPSAAGDQPGDLWSDVQVLTPIEVMIANLTWVARGNLDLLRATAAPPRPALPEDEDVPLLDDVLAGLAHLHEAYPG
jgi:tetratricopeptide (TPR) repeat protein